MMSDTERWSRTQQQIVDATRMDRLRYEREQEQAREEKARRLVEEREAAFLARVRVRRGPLTFADAWDRLREPLDLRAEIAHVRDQARRLGVRLVMVAARDDGSSSATDRIVAIPPLVTREALATTLHELGHQAKPCRPDHQRKRSESGRESYCVRCELNAWGWARAHVYGGIWWPEQQEDLRQGLGSYRRFATTAEKVEMNKLMSAEPTPFAAQRFRLLEICK